MWLGADCTVSTNNHGTRLCSTEFSRNEKVVDDDGDHVTTEHTRGSAHVWLNCSSRVDSTMMSCSQLAARWPRDGLGCQLAAALAVAAGRLRVVPMGSVT
mmetsp:Transcript_19996/g.53927  ORF Transcript_19996/g.53927 Transcript_19996/m.53927 type:complete len:100 (+) Transcript_19996:255-554(+)